MRAFALTVQKMQFDGSQTIERYLPPITIPPSFKKRFKKKSEELRAAIKECVQRLGDNPYHPGLNTHKVRGTQGVWEAYVDDKNRVTFHYEDGGIVMRNNCNHDIIKRSP